MSATKKISEAAIERAVCQYVLSKKGLHYKFSSPSRRAVPDRMFISLGGRVAFIEFKAPGKKPTKMQQREMKKLTDQGCTGAFIDNVEAGKSFIDLWMDGLI